MLKLVCAYPPGVNTLYGVRATMVRGRPMAFPYKTHEHRDYAAQAKLAAFEAGLTAEQMPRWPKGVMLAVELRLFRPRRAGDIDAPLKCLFDVMAGVLWANDDQVAELHVWRGDDKAYPRVEMGVRELVAAEAAKQPPLFDMPMPPRRPKTAVEQRSAPRAAQDPDEPWTKRVRRLATSAAVSNRLEEP